MFPGFVLYFATQGAARLGWTWTGTLSNGAAYGLRERSREAARFFEVRLTSLLPENSRPSGANILDREHHIRRCFQDSRPGNMNQEDEICDFALLLRPVKNKLRMKE